MILNVHSNNCECFAAGHCTVDTIRRTPGTRTAASGTPTTTPGSLSAPQPMWYQTRLTCSFSSCHDSLQCISGHVHRVACNACHIKYGWNRRRNMLWSAWSQSCDDPMFLSSHTETRVIISKQSAKPFYTVQDFIGTIEKKKLCKI